MAEEPADGGDSIDSDGADTDGDDSETICYQFEMDGEEWHEWTVTIPRTQTIADQLRSLIRQDSRAARKSGDIEVASVNVMATRIRIRSRQVLADLESDDDVDVDAAIDQLEEIIDLADALES